MLRTIAIVLWALSAVALDIDLVSNPEATAYNNGRKLIRQSDSRTLNLIYEKDGWIKYIRSYDEGLTWVYSESLKSGQFPCIAIDNNNNPWISYLCNDTVFCLVRNSNSDWTKVVIFSGDSSLSPGPPSIAISPLIPANGLPVGFVTFPVYSSQENHSFIKYAKFDTTQIIVGNVDMTMTTGLVDSFACISLTSGDILHICWQQDKDIFYSKANVQPDYWEEICWSEPYNISNSLNVSSKHPFTETFADSVYVIWIENNNIVLVAIKKISEPNDNWVYRIPTQSGQPKDYPVMRKNQVLTWQEQVAADNWEIYAIIQDNTLNLSETSGNSRYCHVEIGYPNGQPEPMPPEPEGQPEPMPPDLDFVWIEELEPGDQYEVRFFKYIIENNDGPQGRKITNALPLPILYQNNPNPFSSMTKISYLLPIECRTSLKLYDASGKLVRTLIDRIKKSGVHQLIWDGTGRNQKLLPNGIYFYELQVPNAKIVQKMMIMR